MRRPLRTYVERNRKEPFLAREKNTSRSLARRRTRAQMRAELLAAQADEELDTVEEPAPPAQTQRQSMFKMPNIRADLAALPGIFRSKRILFLPLVLLLAGLPAYVLFLRGQLAEPAATIASYFTQFFFIPPALFTFFLAGFFAPRASYLVGAIYGLIGGVLWAIAILLLGQDIAAAPTAEPLVIEPTAVVLQMVALGVVYGTLAAALAAWYRDFLRGIQERGRARRAEREIQERAKRREERQEARRIAKQRPTG